MKMREVYDMVAECDRANAEIAEFAFDYGEDEFPEHIVHVRYTIKKKRKHKAQESENE